MEKSENKFNWSLLISSIIVIIGWGVTYYTTNVQIIKAKQKEIKTNYLIEAYRSLEDGMGRDTVTKDQIRNMEKAISDIQLFGTPGQRKLAKELTDGMNKSSYMDDRELLVLIRNDLRNELGLEQAPTNYEDVYHWRIKKIFKK